MVYKYKINNFTFFKFDEKIHFVDVMPILLRNVKRLQFIRSITTIMKNK